MKFGLSPFCACESSNTAKNKPFLIATKPIYEKFTCRNFVQNEIVIIDYRDPKFIRVIENPGE